MKEAGRPAGLTKDHLYTVGTTPSLRWAGIKGREALVEVATYDAPHVTIQGLKRGRIEFPVADITQLRASVQWVKRTYHYCVIRRRSGPAIVIDGTSRGTDYRELILHLAEEMEGLGRFDRVERGLRAWESLVFLLVWGSLSLLLLYAPFDTWRQWGASWDRDDFLFVGGLFGASVLLAAYSVWTWLRWYRPRRVRDMDDLARVLP